MIDAIDRGAKVVYLDPRFTKTAAKADRMAAHPPGTDLAFHLALLNVIISEELYDSEFVEQYTVGFDELAAAMARVHARMGAAAHRHSRRNHPPHRARIRRRRRNALAHNGWRTSNFINSFQTERAIAILNALGGQCAHPGWLSVAGGRRGERRALGEPPQPAYPRISALRLDGVPWKYPVVPLKIGVFQELRDNILTGEPYQAHGWFISRQNPVLSLPDRSKTLEAFGKMDFIATVDIIMNDTAWFSDVVLPEASYLERYDPLACRRWARVFLRQPVIEPQGEAKSALWIYKQLGERLGLGDFFQYEMKKITCASSSRPWPGSGSARKARLPGSVKPEVQKKNPKFASTRPAGRSKSTPRRWRMPVSLPGLPGKNRLLPPPTASTC